MDQQHIAIIGMAAVFAKAESLQAYWQNIFDKRDCITEASDEWAYPFFDPEPKRGRIYTKKGGFLDEEMRKADPLEFGIMPSSIPGSNPAQFLALNVARDALSDAGYGDKEFNREKTGVILGNCRHEDRGTVSAFHYYYMEEQIIHILRNLLDVSEETLAEIRSDFDRCFPPYNPDYIPGIIESIIASRIANRFDLMGPAYVLDASCTSSLTAVRNSAYELISGDCDMMLAGGTFVTASPSFHMLFCTLEAISRTDIRPFSKSANGILLGEGLGMVVLKRLDDAVRDRDRIYAVIKGIGCASDGKSQGILNPRLEGEAAAIERAYRQCNISPRTVTLVEAHGTATLVGDPTEVGSLYKVFGDRKGLFPTCALGSVKSMIGHTIAAAGIAGLIKITLALYHKVLPPTLCEEVNPELELEKTRFFINTETQPWIHSPASPRRAAANAFGFGGINTHIILEEHAATDKEPQLLHKHWPGEILLFCGEDRKQLAQEITRVCDVVDANSHVSIADLAYTLSDCREGSCRLAVVAKNAKDLVSKLRTAREKLDAGTKQQWRTRHGIYYSQKPRRGKIAFLFPGQNSQYSNMLKDLYLYFPDLHPWFDVLAAVPMENSEETLDKHVFPPPGLSEEDRQRIEANLRAHNAAVSSVLLLSYGLFELIRRFQIPCQAVVGHSAGETTALIAAGKLPLPKKPTMFTDILHGYSVLRKEALQGTPEGAFVAIGGRDRQYLEELIKSCPCEVHMTMDNCPNQVVLFAAEQDRDRVHEYFTGEGYICMDLPIGGVNHTPLYRPIEKIIHDDPKIVRHQQGHTAIYSCVTSEPFPEDPEASLALSIKQLYTPVRFRQTLLQMYEDGVRTFIEVGPNNIVTSFVKDTLGELDCLAVALDNQQLSSFEQLLHSLAQLFVRGVPIDFTPLYEYRYLQRLDFSATPARKKPKQTLDNRLPWIEPSEQLVRKLRSHTATATRPPSPVGDDQNCRPTAVDNSVISEHFKLMQQFLTNQEKFLEICNKQK